MLSDIYPITSVCKEFRGSPPFQFKDRAAMGLAAGIHLLLDHSGQKIQSRVSVFIQQDGISRNISSG